MVGLFGVFGVCLRFDLLGCGVVVCCFGVVLLFWGFVVVLGLLFC